MIDSLFKKAKTNSIFNFFQKKLDKEIASQSKPKIGGLEACGKVYAKVRNFHEMGEEILNFKQRILLRKL